MSDQHDDEKSGLSPYAGTSGAYATSRANPRVKPSDVAKVEAARRAKLKKKITDRFIAKSAQEISDLVDGWDEKALDSIEAGIDAGAVTIEVFKDGVKVANVSDLKSTPIGSGLSRKQINEVIDEVLAPEVERQKAARPNSSLEEVEAAFERKSQSTNGPRGRRTLR